MIRARDCVEMLEDDVVSLWSTWCWEKERDN